MPEKLIACPSSSSKNNWFFYEVFDCPLRVLKLASPESFTR